MYKASSINIRKYLLIIGFLFVILTGLFSNEIKQTQIEISQDEFRSLENKAFKVGEKLIYSVDYGFINAGEAVMSIDSIVIYNNRPCYYIVSEAKSNRFFNKIFKVKDVFESWMDQDGLFSWKFVKKIREGSYRSHRWANFDQKNHTAVTEKKTMDIMPYTQDILSGLYYLRTVDLKIGTSVAIGTNADGKNYPLQVKIHKREKIKVPAGIFNCIKVEPLLRSEGVFKQKGKMTVWLTDDNRKIPVLMKSKVFIGSISARLKEVKFN